MYIYVYREMYVYREVKGYAEDHLMKVIKSVLRKIRNRGDVSDETLDYSCEQP